MNAHPEPRQWKSTPDEAALADAEIEIRTALATTARGKEMA